MIAVLLDASVRVALVAASVALILAASRVRASGVRHAAWTSVLGAMLLMPALPRITPSIDVPLRISATLDALPELLIPGPPASVNSQPPASAVSPALTFQSSVPVVAIDVVEAPRLAWPSWSQSALGLYLSGALVLFGRLMIGFAAVQRIKRTARLAEGSGQAAVYQSNLVATPVIAGVLNPRVVLPVGWTEWPNEKFEAILAHEHAHIRRRDPLVAFLAHVNRCLFWFHPLAWWLERTLAETAEHVCDDQAVRAIGERRRYAEVLLDMADAVRRSGGRVVWQGVGVDGTGLLGARIDRVLSGELFRRVSRARKVSVALSCATAIFVIVACKQPAKAEALQPDPNVAEMIARNRANTEEWNAARDLTAQQVDELEAIVKKDPADFAALKKLRTFYQASGQKVFGWNEMVARRLPHILRLIDRYPEHELAAWRVSSSADPGGYAEAKKHWLAQAARPGVTAMSLTHAAYFLEENEPQLAEELLLRARSVDPEGRTLRYAYEADRPAYWSRRLGTFYGRAIVGPRSPNDGHPLKPLDSDPYARNLRIRLATSDDAPMLGAAGTQLVQSSYFDPARGQLGRQFLERALQLDPAQLDARRGWLWAEEARINQKTRDALRTKQAELAGGEVARKVRGAERLSETEQEQLRTFELEAVSSLPEADRLLALGNLATTAYMFAEHSRNRTAAQASFDRSKKAAGDALTLASKLREHPDYSVTVYRATMALATHALREGDRARAVRYMLEAARVPASEQFGPGGAMDDSLTGRVVNYLLKAGERESVAEFLERSARLAAADTNRMNRLLKDAASIRAGVMPMSYQYAVARGE